MNNFLNKLWRWRWCLVLVLILANLFFWLRFYQNSSRDFLSFSALDIGQGDAIFIEDQAGHQILIDGGPAQKILEELPKYLRLSDRFIDLIILTHPHADHLAGLVEVAKRYQIGGVLESGAVYQSAVYTEWHRLLTKQNIPVIPARAGEVIKLAGDVRLEILAPLATWTGREAPEIHDSMVVARLVVATSTGLALFTGDMEQDLEQKLLARGVDVSARVLKVGHHGSRTSTGERFLEKVRPDYAIISLGKDNRYGHPHQITLDTLSKLNIKILRTDEVGSVDFRTCSLGVCPL